MGPAQSAAALIEIQSDVIGMDAFADHLPEASSRRGSLEKTQCGFLFPRGGMAPLSQYGQSKLRGYLRGERIRTKKYLYVIRPVLACQWIEQSDAPPPMAFEDLLDRLLPAGDVREAIDDLLVVKRVSKEV